MGVTKCRGAMACGEMLLFVAALFPAAGLAAPPPHPMITPPPSLENARTEQKRDLGEVGSYVDGVISGFGSDVSSYIASGIPQFFQDLPTGSQVLSSLGLKDDDLKASPTSALNIPAYANWTDEGWNVRVHGNIYKEPDLSTSKLNDLADVFLIGTDCTDLPKPQQTNARNMTAEIFVVQQEDVSVTVNFIANVDVVDSDHDGGAVPAKGGNQTIKMPYNTTTLGDFDAFVKLDNTTGADGKGYMMKGNETDRVQVLDMYVNGTDSGNATTWLVPPEGFTVLSDVDDILRVTKIYDPVEGLMNSFAKDFRPWMNMPEIYANWSQSMTDLHFHYLTTTPEQVTRSYMDFIYSTYPLGSFDTRPLNFSDVQATLHIRKHLLDKIFQTFPQRKFVLVADTSNSDIMKDYPQMYKDYPGQVQCILLRNTSSTDSSDKFPYDTSGFKDIPQDNYMFFNIPDDLTNLDIRGGHCHNKTIKQNVTFDTQGLPWDHDNAGVANRPGLWQGVTVAGVMAMVMMCL